MSKKMCPFGEIIGEELQCLKENHNCIYSLEIDKYIYCGYKLINYENDQVHSLFKHQTIQGFLNERS